MYSNPPYTDRHQRSYHWLTNVSRQWLAGTRLFVMSATRHSFYMEKGHFNVITAYSHQRYSCKFVMHAYSFDIMMTPNKVWYSSIMTSWWPQTRFDIPALWQIDWLIDTDRSIEREGGRGRQRQRDKEKEKRQRKRERETDTEIQRQRPGERETDRYITRETERDRET